MIRTIRLAPSGREFTAAPGESVLEAALRHGLLLPYGCRNGACGACRARLLRGAVEYPGEPPEGLAPGSDGQGEALLCQARAATDLLLEVDEAHDAGALAAKRYAVRVAALDRLAHDVMRLRLQLPRAERMPFVAGQYIDIITRGGHRRAFSLANPPHCDDALELHVRFFAGGEFTEHVFDGMRVGEVLQIDGPHGSFHLRETSTRPALMLAGGTGFAPLKALLEHAIYRGLTRPVHLYWGVRARRDLYQAELPAAWARAHPWFRFTPVLSEPRPEEAWTGRTGLLHAAAVGDHPDACTLEVYACGPPVMVKAAHDALRAHGLPEGRFFSDPFEFGAPQDARQDSGPA